MIVGEHGWPNWRGETAVIVAGGASAAKAKLDIAKGRAKVVAINESWRLCPWADVLYGCDGGWWKIRNGVPEFNGIKISYDQAACLAYPGLRKVNLRERCCELLLDPPGVISDGGSKKPDEVGGNSGWQAVNLITQWGVSRIALVGFDMAGEHWHGRHPAGLGNPSEKLFKVWRKGFDEAAPRFAELGITVLNCSLISTISAYPKVSLLEALEHFDAVTREGARQAS